MIFVVSSSIFYALFTPSLARRFSKRFDHGYEPLFYDSTLSFSEKVVQWRTDLAVTMVLMLSLLAVGVASAG